MSITEELREMLDERGVKHDDDDCCLCSSTKWKCDFGKAELYEDYTNRYTEVSVCYDDDITRLEITSDLNPPEHYVFPRQAIDVTVGRDTCHTVLMDCFGNPPFNKSGLQGNDVVCGCSECGAPWGTTGLFRGNKLRHNFKACPICGRRVAG